MAKPANFVSAYRAAVNQLLDARETLKTLREQDAAAQVETGTSISGALQSADLAGTNADLAPGDVVAAIEAAGTLESQLTDFAQSPPRPTALLAALLKLRQ